MKAYRDLLERAYYVMERVLVEGGGSEATRRDLLNLYNEIKPQINSVPMISLDRAPGSYVTVCGYQIQMDTYKKTTELLSSPKKNSLEAIRILRAEAKLDFKAAKAVSVELGKAIEKFDALGKAIEKFDAEMMP